jgi:hypothetical protein
LEREGVNLLDPPFGLAAVQAMLALHDDDPVGGQHSEQLRAVRFRQGAVPGGGEAARAERLRERGDWRIDEAELATGDGPRVLTLAPPSQATPLPFPVDDRPRGGMCVRSV